MQLSKDIIIDAAVEILDNYGLPDLTIRRLARHLNAAAGAMYWHFPSKQALLGGVAERILAEAGTPTGTGDWRLDVTAYAFSLREALIAHNDGAEVVAAALAAATLDTSPAAIFSDLLLPLGLPADDRADASATLLYFVLGATVDEQTAKLARAETQHTTDPAARLRRGVTIITAGIAANAGR
ncbi:TetR family transcriptional regulator [Corynebacterium sp. TAE3-ERU12]|uniref:TetR family transcriptional regulator n=1 Tax=Corynebacterium sp. TAE3-ERU12 TaxID=2849491 RepID=UPI001C44E24A|nr:TetR family transcriptional regulator [Corynebacterium sp. TAE3-ERU12]